MRAYYERLLVDGVQDYTFNELWTDYRLSHLVNTSVAVITGGTMDLANERGGNSSAPSANVTSLPSSISDPPT